MNERHISWFHFTVIMLYVTTQSQCKQDWDGLCPVNAKGTCSAGCHKTDHGCKKCADGLYTEFENSIWHCFPCVKCDESVQVEVRPCNATMKRVCTCKHGFYEDEGFCRPCDDASDCEKYSNCKEKCKLQTVTTSTITTTKMCERGYFPEGGQCHSCVKFRCMHDSCNSFCTSINEKPDLPLLFTLPVLCGILCLLLIRYCKWRTFCRREKNLEVGIPDQPDRPTNINIPLMFPVTSNPPRVCEAGNFSQKGSGELLQTYWKETWPAAKLYTVIRAIPVQRWKEFLRLLSLSDDQMDRIELEGASCYMEKQYKMLSLWSQSSEATLEKIYSTLHYMNLSGCAHELQEKLKQL